MDKKGEALAEVNARVNGDEPFRIEGSQSYYEVISINGITEVIEHRKIEPVFYINDDAMVLKKLGLQ